MPDTQTYLSKLQGLPLAEKQAELLHCERKLSSAATLHEIGLVEYYLEALGYLRMFRIVDECPDILYRSEIDPPLFFDEENAIWT